MSLCCALCRELIVSSLCMPQPSGWNFRGTARSRGTTHVISVAHDGSMGVSSAEGESSTIMKRKTVRCVLVFVASPLRFVGLEW